MYPSGSVPILQQKIAAFITASDRLCTSPDQIRMQVSVSGVITVAECCCDLRTSISVASLVIRAMHDVEPGFIAVAFRELILKSGIGSKALHRDLHKELRDPFRKDQGSGAGSG